MIGNTATRSPTRTNGNLFTSQILVRPQEEYTYFMKKVFLVALLIIAFIQSPAVATESNNKFKTAQSGVHYQIFQPGPTGDLILRSFNMQSCGPKNERWLAAIYGEDRSIQFLETDAAIKCSNPGLGVKVATADINGNKATIVAFCDPSNKKQWKSCKTSDIHNYGGYAIWKVPPTKLLHATEIEVLVSGFAYEDLLKLAKGMKPVTQ